MLLMLMATTMWVMTAKLMLIKTRLVMLLGHGEHTGGTHVTD